MADRFWVGNSGNWSDNTNHWSASQGGAPGASKPTSADRCRFIGGFTIAGQTVTVDEPANCNGIDFTGATNSPTLAYGGFALQVTGPASVIFISAMTLTGGTAANTGLYLLGGGLLQLTTNGSSHPERLTFADGGVNGVTLELLDDITFTTGILPREGTFTTNGHTLNLGALSANASSGVTTINLGASVVNCTTGFNIIPAVTGTVVLNSGTSTINCTATTTFQGNGQTYNIVNLNGTAHTITGNNTFAQLNLRPTGAQTITGTAGSTQTVKRFFIASHGKNVITLNSTGAAWTLTGNSGYFEDDYLSLTNVVAGYARTYFAGDHSTDGTGNTNWIFQRVIRPSLHGGRVLCR